MPELSLSPRAIKEAAEWFKNHPVVTLKQIREIQLEGEGGELEEVEAAVCTKCGFELVPDSNPMFEGQNRYWPKGVKTAVYLTHAFDQATRKVYCGGHMLLRTKKMTGLVAVK